MDIISHAELITQIDAFLIRHRMAESRFGRDATGEADLVRTLRSGRHLNHRTLLRIAEFMAEQDRLLEAGDSVSEPSASPGKEWPITGEAADDAAIGQAA